VIDAETINSDLDRIKRTTQRGINYWTGRELQPVLGYDRWENFKDVIEKGRMACESAGIDAGKHFREVTKEVPSGSGAHIMRQDFFLTREACYLIAMNGDSRKPQIGAAQAYFTVQTRRQEVQDQTNSLQPRIASRQRIKEGNKRLNGAAKEAGVQRYGTFHDAGYRGLYNGLRKSEIESLKKIPAGEDLLDCIDHAELAMNEFRITQTQEKLTREGIHGETNAINMHYHVGRAVRKTVEELQGTMPEKRPAQPSIRKALANKKAKGLNPAASTKLIEGSSSS
jgi:DNA-damage-inducible protein D